jgi:hypothetical protein
MATTDSAAQSSADAEDEENKEFIPGAGKGLSGKETEQTGTSFGRTLNLLRHV